MQRKFCPMPVIVIRSKNNRAYVALFALFINQNDRHLIASAWVVRSAHIHTDFIFSTQPSNNINFTFTHCEVAYSDIMVKNVMKQVSPPELCLLQVNLALPALAVAEEHTRMAASIM